MLKEDKITFILTTLEQMFPHAGCELIYHNPFELMIAVVLSAQTKDTAVNKVTKDLFLKYPTPSMLAQANYDDVYMMIKPIGLAKNKTKNILNLASIIANQYHGLVPNTLDELTSLPGVGRKSANVILSEAFGVPRIAVDTHVDRVSKKLGLASNDDSVYEVELKLMKLMPESYYHRAHHLLLFFGRYFCTSKKPNCDNCPFKSICTTNMTK